MIKKLNAAPMTAASITVRFPVTSLELFVLLDCLYNGDGAGSEETARRRKDLYGVLSVGWDWEEFAKKDGLKPSEFETQHEFTLAKSHLETIKALAAKLAEKMAGRFSFAAIDLMDRINYVLTAE